MAFDIAPEKMSFDIVPDKPAFDIVDEKGQEKSLGALDIALGTLGAIPAGVIGAGTTLMKDIASPGMATGG